MKIRGTDMNFLLVIITLLVVETILQLFVLKKGITVKQSLITIGIIAVVVLLGMLLFEKGI